MRLTIILIAALLGLSKMVLAQDDKFASFSGLPTGDFATNAVTNYVIAPESVPCLRILPEDVVQDSIQQVRFSTNQFAVRWTWTEAGAKKMLAFNETHEGKKVMTVIGSFKSPPFEHSFRPMPPVFTNYTHWKEGWLKRRTDKIFVNSEENAKAIADGLKRK